MEEKGFEMGSDFFAFLSSLASHPLVSIVIALYSMILIYFPRVFMDILFSPVLILTGILLTTLLRVGSNQRVDKNVENEDFLELPDDNLEWVSCKKEKEPEPKGGETVVCSPEQSFPNCFVEWDVRAPLEVIYEEYEEGQDEEDHNNNDKESVVSIHRLASLSRYYPESDDTGSSSSGDDNGDFRVTEGWDSPENMFFRWDEEDKEGLIEIELGDGHKENYHNSCDNDQFVHQGEEDNLIEIDISPTGSPMEWRDFPGIDVRFNMSSP